MGNTKQMIIKNRTYYIFNDTINNKEFDSSQLIYYIRYITIKSISDFENVNNVNPLYLIIAEVNGYIEENNGNKHLTFASTDKTKTKKC